MRTSTTPKMAAHNPPIDMVSATCITTNMVATTEIDTAAVSRSRSPDSKREALRITIGDTIRNASVKVMAEKYLRFSIHPPTST